MDTTTTQDTQTTAPVGGATDAPDRAAIDAATDAATRRIAPTWPLDRFIAVNPLWGFVERPLPDVAARVGALSGTRLLMPRGWYREQLEAGRLRRAHLEQAIVRTGARVTVDQLEAIVADDAPTPPRRALVSDLVDANRDLAHEMSWQQFVTYAVSQHCAAYFDDGQSRLGPDRAAGLFAGWRRQADDDHGPALLMGMGSYRQHARNLPRDRDALIATALRELDVDAAEVEAYLTALLMDVGGWAAWCAYLRWTAELDGGTDEHIVDLLAVRLAWELVLVRAGGEQLARRWQVAMAGWAATDREAANAQAHDWVIQEAMEIAYREPLLAGLPAGVRAPRPEAPRFQAAFCIDVRSEVFRRALEAERSDVQTLGFAGFFGLPIAYQPLGAPDARPQLPGLLAPKMLATDTGVGDDVRDKRGARLDLGEAWTRFKTNAVSGFSYVESVGLFYAGKLLGDALGRTRPAAHPEHAGLSRGDDHRRKPRLTAKADGTEATLDERVTLAEGILRAMSVSQGLAPVVALVGHGSQTVNNPHAAGYDCGACCGQSGEVNARATAALLNDPEVRAGLSERGIQVPEGTWFIGGLHDTTVDEVTLFDLDEVPAAHGPAIAELQAALARAGARARAERAPRLGIDPGQDPTAIRAAVERRARDWAQVRPEWGLAGNAAFVVAPREHVAHLDLAGRSFLHDYRWDEDPDGFPILELIMTAPMVVTHWINFQYYASTVDNVRYGSGNKVLHNVVGGHIGVFEGNGGDLRVGLPIQSLHDGRDWVHTPLRLNVFIEAPRHAIDGILAKHDLVRQLADHGWLHLFQVTPPDVDEAPPGTIHAYRGGTWVQETDAVVASTEPAI